MTDKNHPLPTENKQEPEPRRIPEDEISLIDLLGILYKKRLLVLSITFLSTLLATAYCFWSPSIYRAKVGVISPKGIVAPEWVPKDLTTETNDSIYKQYLTRIISHENQKDIFDRGEFHKRFSDKSGKPIAPEKLSIKDHESISTQKDLMGSETTFIIMEGTKPEFMSEFLNVLSTTTIEKIQTETINLLQTKIANKLKVISQKIEHAKLKNKNDQLRKLILKKIENQANRRIRSQNRIDSLSEQLTIAKNVKIKKHNFNKLNNNAPLWFLYGEDYLKKEIEVLKSNLQIENQQANSAKPKVISRSEDTDRKTSATDNDMYFDSLVKFGAEAKSALEVKLESEQKNLKAIDSSLAKPEVATITQVSFPPENPIRPNKVKLILSGLLLGFGFGVVLAFLTNIIAGLKEKHLVT